MSGIRFSFPASVIAGKGRIDRHDVLILRKYSFADGIRNYDDALLMLALNDMCVTHCDEWKPYFIEALCAFIVDIAPPEGRIDPLKSAWLMQVLGLDGAVSDALHLELLLHAIERADSCADILSAFALDQLRLSFCDDPMGVYGAGRSGSHGITARDLAYVWRILRHAVEDGRLLLTPLEASILHMIDDLVEACDNHPGWSEVMEHVTGEKRPAGRLRMRPWLMMADVSSGSQFG